MGLHQIPGEPKGVYEARAGDHPSMSLREGYAGLALLGYHAGRPVAPSDPRLTTEVVAMGCVRYADAMIAELARPIPQVEEVDLRDMTMWDHDVLTGRKVVR